MMIDIKTLPIIELGDRQPAFARNHPGVRLDESVTDMHSDLNIASRHLDYSSMVNHIHKQVSAHLRTPEAHEANSIAKDILQKGLNVGNYENAHSVIASHVKNPFDAAALHKSYSEPLENHSPNNVDMKKDHPTNHVMDEDTFHALRSGGFSPVHGSLIKSAASGNTYHLNQQTGDLNFHSSSFSRNDTTHAYAAPLRHPDEGHQSNLADDMRTGFDKDSHSSANRQNFLKYAKESGDFNRLHVRNHLNDYDDHDSTNYDPEAKKDITERSKMLTDHIRSSTKHPEQFHVFTSISSKSNLEKGHAPVDVDGNMLYHAPAFSSTSILPSQALSFARLKTSKTDGDVHDMLKVKIPTDYKHGAYLAPISEHHDEEEYLLNKGHTFKIHPKPTYFANKGKVHRIFSAEIVDQNHIDGNNHPVLPDSWNH